MSTHPTGSLKHRGALAVPLWAVQRLDHREHHHHRGLFRQHRGVRSLLRSSDRPAVHRGDAILHRAPQGGADRLYGGRCHFVDHAARIYAASEQLAKELNGHYMDQFTYAERATDWRGNNNIADSIFRQMAREPLPGAETHRDERRHRHPPRWGRYIRYQGHDTQLTVVDPENSVFYDCFHHGDRT